MSVEFKTAERSRVWLKMCLQGPSGSGKTYSALRIATGLVTEDKGKIAFLDTENESASLYANDFKFDTLSLSPPFTTQRYIEAINAAVKAGYRVLVIDSISHQWNGDGGILDRIEKEKRANPKVNSYTVWNRYTPEHETFKSSLNQSPIHILATMRSKQAYVLEENDKGKQTPKRMGMEAIQRDGFEYEFTTVLDLSSEHYATATKDRTKLFDGQHFVPTEETGEKIIQWLNSAPAKPKTLDRRTLLAEHAHKTGWPLLEVQTLLQEVFDTSTAADLTDDDFAKVLDTMTKTAPPGLAAKAKEQAEADAQRITNIAGLPPKGATVQADAGNPPPSVW